MRGGVPGQAKVHANSVASGGQGKVMRRVMAQVVVVWGEAQAGHRIGWTLRYAGARQASARGRQLPKIQRRLRERGGPPHTKSGWVGGSGTLWGARWWGRRLGRGHLGPRWPPDIIHSRCLYVGQAGVQRRRRAEAGGETRGKRAGGGGPQEDTAARRGTVRWTGGRGGMGENSNNNKRLFSMR